MGDDDAASKCGSTVAGILFDAANPSQALVMHAGDSRVYCLVKGKLRQIAAVDARPQLGQCRRGGEA